MNKKSFKRIIYAVTGYYLLVVIVIAVVVLRKLLADTSTLRFLIPSVIAIPAPWLAYCFQQRQAYLNNVLGLWFRLISASQEAIQYTHFICPDQDTFASACKSLSAVIEEVRGVFANIGETDDDGGLYPFEGLKTILTIISELGFGAEVPSSAAKEARNKILEAWKKTRHALLSELPRGVPIRPDSPFYSASPRRRP